MAFTHTIGRSYLAGTRDISATTSYSGDVSTSLSISIPGVQDGYEVPFSLARGNGIVSMAIVSDQDIDVFTNADSPGQTDTLNLLANIPYIWHTDWYKAILITADITTLFIDNAGASAATLQMEFLTDAIA